MPGRGCLLGMGGMCERGLVRGPTSSCIKQVSASSHLPGEAGTLDCHPLSPSLLTYSWSWTPSSCPPLSPKAEAGRGWLQGLPQWDLERRQGQATFLEQKPPCIIIAAPVTICLQLIDPCCGNLGVLTCLLTPRTFMTFYELF